MAGRPIDEKIVAMKMDNSDFKEKAAETTTLFGKLQSALNKIPGVNLGKTTQDLNDIQRAAGNTNMSSLQKAVETISSRFSTLGVVATTALVNITNKAVDAGLEMARSFTTEPIMDGFKEYETKMGSIQTILANTQAKGTTLKDVTASLNELNTYADKTIYSFSDMTKNIGLFTNAGLGLKESTSMIKGFSNAAAASGSNAQQAANAAYQLSQGLSSGYIMTQDWMSLTNAGMGNDNMKRDLIAIGQAMGTLNKSTGTTDKTLKNWKDSLSNDKWLTTNVMSLYLQAMTGDMDEAALMAKGLTKAQADLLIQNAKTGVAAATYVRTFSQLFGALKESIGSGWAETFELIIGNFDVATTRLTALSNALGNIVQTSSNNRNLIVKNLADAGVFQSIFTVVTDALTAIADVFTAISTGFQKAFPPANVTNLNSVAKGIKAFADALVPTPAVLAKITTISQGFFSIIHAGISIVETLAKALINLIPPGTGAAILSFAEYVGKLVISFAEFVGKVATSKPVVDALSSTFRLIGSTIMEIVKGAAELGKALIDMIPSDLGTNLLNAINYVATLVTSFTDSAKSGSAMGSSVKGVNKVLSELGKIVSDVSSGIKNAFGSIVNYLDGIKLSLTPVENGFKNFFIAIGNGWIKFMNALTTVFNFMKEHMPDGRQLLAGGFLAALATLAWKATKFGKDFKDAFMSWFKLGDGLKGILDGIKELLEGVGKSLKAFTLQVRANALLTIAIAVGVLAASFLILSKVKSEDIATGLLAIIGSLSALSGAMVLISKLGAGKIEATSLQIVAISVAISILADALIKVSKLKWEEIGKGLTGLVATMGTLTAAIVIMSKYGGNKIETTTLQIIGIAVALKLMLSTIQDLGKINTGQLWQGVEAVGFILLEIAAFLKIADGSKFGLGSTLGMLAIGRAIKGIVSAVQEMSKIDTKVLDQGLTTIGYILLGIATFAAVTSDRGLLSTGVGLLLVTAALNGLIIPITILGNMNINKLNQGLMAMAVALGEVAIASMLMEGSIVAGAGLILIAAGLTLLLIPIAAFGAMKWTTLLEGLFGLGAALLIIGGTTLLLSEAIPLLTAFGLGILALGAGVALAGGGLILFGIGLATLAGVSISAVASIISVIGALIVGLGSLIPTAVSFVAEIVIALMDTLIKYTPPLVDKLATLLLSLMNELEKWIPPLVDKAVELITKLVEAMAQAIQDNGQPLLDAIMHLLGEVLILVIQAGVEVITALFGWIPGVKDATKTIGDTATQTIRDTFGASEVGHEKGKEFTDALGSHTGDANVAGFNIANFGKMGANSIDMRATGQAKGVDFASGLSSNTDLTKLSGFNIANASKMGAGSIDMTSTGQSKGVDFASGLASKTTNATTSGVNLANAGKGGANSIDLSSIGQIKGIDFASGLESKLGSARNSGVTIANSGKSGAGSVDMTTTGSWFGQGFANGITNTKDSVWNSAVALAKHAKDAVWNWLDINSPSRVMMESGGWFGEGFAIGISDKTKRVGENAKGLAMTAKNSLNKFLDGFELPDNNELKFKATIDYDKFDPTKFGGIAPVGIAPDTSLTNGLVAVTKSKMGQNGSINGNVNNSTATTNHNYNINVQANDTSTRAGLKKLAQQIQTELKNLDDRGRMSRGEGVAF
jgi:tape measure domain-containing protein